jgi:hypothetical protein
VSKGPRTVESSVRVIWAGVPGSQHRLDSSIHCSRYAPFVPDILPAAKPPLSVGRSVAAGKCCGPGFVTFKAWLMGKVLVVDASVVPLGTGDEVLNTLVFAVIAFMTACTG